MFVKLFLNENNSPYKYECENILYGFKTLLLNLEIEITIWKLERLKLRLTSLKLKLKNTLLYYFLKKNCDTNYNRNFNKINSNNIINLLITNYFLTIRTDVQLPDEVSRILSFGPNKKF